MTYATIITPVADAPEVEPHLAAAVLLARSFGAGLIGSGAEISMPPPGDLGLGDPSLSGELAVLERSLVEEDLRAAEQRFLQASAGAERREWRSSIELPLHALVRRALSTDLVVMGRMPADRNDILRAVSAGDVVMKAGRPVLHVPAGGVTAQPRTVAIAWKDTRQARRAVADALPFLRRADTVLAFAVPERRGREEANEGLTGLIGYLNAHSIKATAVCLPGSDSAGADLVHAAARSGADLLVAGAYGRSRVEEWVLGGVTRVLLEAQLPVFFSH